jgi:unsaturated chondroitin disaccharide hydrolase
MKNRNIIPFTALLLVLLCFAACQPEEKPLDTEMYLNFAIDQVYRALENQLDFDEIPRNVPQGKEYWETRLFTDWTSGFWPGIIWYIYDYTGDEGWMRIAYERNFPVAQILQRDYKDHDLGFQFYCSFGNGYRLTGDNNMKQTIIQAADQLAAMYNPVAGTILSWPWAHNRYATPHNTIIDNMMNLELLFWAAKNGGSPSYYDLAVRHATVTMENQLRPDYSSWHVLAYDTLTGKAVQKVTAQGYADKSMWARGQAWGIYGFTLTYRETGNPEFLETAKKMAQIYIDRLPEDHVPYWDFDAPDIPDAPRDASAAAITASALLELSTLVNDTRESKYYRSVAADMLRSLTKNYLSDGSNVAVLDHSVGHFTENSEVDIPIIYADYYFIEALLRERKLQKNK